MMLEGIAIIQHSVFSIQHSTLLLGTLSHTTPITGNTFPKGKSESKSAPVTPMRSVQMTFPISGMLVIDIESCSCVIHGIVLPVLDASAQLFLRQELEFSRLHTSPMELHQWRVLCCVSYHVSGNVPANQDSQNLQHRTTLNLC
jgi:hypothetical protein